MPSSTSQNPRSQLDALLGHADSLPTTTEKGAFFERISDYALLNAHAFRGLIREVVPFGAWAAKNLAGSTAAARRDNGVDRIAVMHDGSIAAVQNKGYARDRSASYGDLSNFILQGRDVAGATRLLWVTSGSGLNSNAAGMDRAAGTGIEVLNYEWLATAVDSYPTVAELLAGAATPTAPQSDPFVLFPDQRRGRDAILAELVTAREAQSVAACGTGKTVLAHAVHDALGAELTAFFVPTLGLMRQSIRSWERQSPVPLNIIAVCSDETVLNLTTKAKAADHLVVGEQDFGKRLYRDAAELAAALAGRRLATYIDGDGVTHPCPTVVFSTYHSAQVVVDAQHLHGAAEFDFVTLDEAHFLTGDGEFGEVVKRKNDGRQRLLAAKRLFMTATPKTYGQNALDKAESRGLTLDPMTEQSPVFGRRVHHYSFGAAIADGRLSPYKVSIVAVPEDAAVDVAGNVEVIYNGRVGKHRARHEAAALAIQEAVAGGDRNLVSYHSTVASARGFADLIRERGVTATSDHVHGGQNAAEREGRINQMVAAATGHLANVRCLNEGVDIPELDAVVFVDPKSQPTDIVQSVGRVMRKHHSKDHGHIIVVVPVSIEMLAADPDTAARAMSTDPRWKTAFNVLKAMAEHDSAVNELVENILIGGDRRTQARCEDHWNCADCTDDTVCEWHGTCPQCVRRVTTILGGDSEGRMGGLVEFVTLAGRPMDLRTLRRGFRLATIRSLSPEWSVGYLTLKAWLETHGANYPKSTSADRDELRVFKWAAAQKNPYKESALSRGQQDRLDQLPKWGEWVLTKPELHKRTAEDLILFQTAHPGVGFSDEATSPFERRIAENVVACKNYLVTRSRAGNFDHRAFKAEVFESGRSCLCERCVG